MVRSYHRAALGQQYTHLGNEKKIEKNVHKNIESNNNLHFVEIRLHANAEFHLQIMIIKTTLLGVFYLSIRVTKIQIHINLPRREL